MNLEFRVLWFDDTRDFFDSLDLTPFTDRVSSWGFEPKVDVVYTPAEFTAKAPFHEYDLITVDYDLGNNEPHGDTFIKMLRDNRVYTEVVFYSANPASDLWAAIGTAQLEGVFVANRQVIVDRLEAVAYQSVRKVLDLNNMRGMVMAEVGDIDGVLDAILAAGIPALAEDERAGIFERFHSEAEKQATQRLEEIAAFKEDPSVEKLLDLCDSSKRYDNFNRLKKRHAKVQGVEIGNYFEDVLSPRNFLAHAQPKLTDDGHVFSWRGKEYRFNESTSVALRKLILTYRRKFREIYAALSQ